MVITCCIEYVYACWRSQNRPRLARLIFGKNAGWVEGGKGERSIIEASYREEYKKRLRILLIYRYMMGKIDMNSIDCAMPSRYHDRIKRDLDSEVFKYVWGCENISEVSFKKMVANSVTLDGWDV